MAARGVTQRRASAAVLKVGICVVDAMPVSYYAISGEEAVDGYWC
jgi:hypothetical protein